MDIRASMASAVLALLVLLAPAGARALVLSATTTTPGTNVAMTQTSSFSVIWRVETDDSQMFWSERGQFLLPTVDLTLAGTVDRRLTRSLSAMGVVTTQVREVVVVPASILARAQREGFSHVLYYREFVDADGQMASATFRLELVGASGAGFGVTRIEVSFDDGTLVRLVDTGSNLRARAEVQSNGSGFLRGVWEIADAASTLGRPIYRPLQSVSHALSGASERTFTSPVLPTDNEGLHVIRFRVLEPDTAFAIPALRYYVGTLPGQKPPAMPVGVIVESPSHLASLDDDTRFRWRPIEGAVVYQLEIYAQPSEPLPPPSEPQWERLVEAAALGRPPIGGVVVPASRTEAGLEKLTRERLTSGHTYLWRVIAVGPEGAILGTSPLSELVVP
jgi:hypothetical protein